VGNADVNELRQIASPPYSETVYRVADFDSIGDIQDALSARLCENDGTFCSTHFGFYVSLRCYFR